MTPDPEKTAQAQMILDGVGREVQLRMALIKAKEDLTVALAEVERLKSSGKRRV